MNGERAGHKFTTAFFVAVAFFTSVFPRKLFLAMKVVVVVFGMIVRKFLAATRPFSRESGETLPGETKKLNELFNLFSRL